MKENINITNLSTDESITEIITIEELTEILHIGRNNAYKLLNSGKIKAFRIGKTWKIPLNSVMIYIREQCKF